MDLCKLKQIFKKYVENYDLSDTAIRGKLEHSYRVMDISILLAKSIELNDEDIKVATLIGLLHDYARFEQWTKFRTYNDLNSIDHGDLAVYKLFDKGEIIDYCDNVSYYDRIYNAIKYHNKYSYPNNLSDDNKRFCKIIRDADKVDIFYLLGSVKELLKEDDMSISDEVSKNFFNEKLISREMVKNKSDNVILSLAMVFDLELDYSFKYILDNKLIEKMFDNIIDKNKFSLYFEYIYNYIQNKVN